MLATAAAVVDFIEVVVFFADVTFEATPFFEPFGGMLRVVVVTKLTSMMYNWRGPSWPCRKMTEDEEEELRSK